MRLPTRGQVAVAAAVLATACAPRPHAASDTLAISVPYEISTLDPHAEDTASAYAVLGHFYEGLVATDAEMRIVPRLAQRWETPDDRTWLFHLRPGVSFADGSRLEAEDVVWSLRRLTTVPGLEVAGYAAHVAEVEALDHLTLRLRTRAPLSVLLNKLAFLSIVRRDTTPDVLARTPNGTGPYTLVDWSGDVMRIARRDGYWGPLPDVREATIRLGRSPRDAAADLLAGRAQIAQCSSREAEKTLRADGRFVVESRPSIFVKYLGFNVGRERLPDGGPNPFRDPRVREAVDVALDRHELVNELPQGAIPAAQFVPATIFGFRPNVPVTRPDRARARALLAEAGYARGFRAPLVARHILGGAAEVVRDQLRAVGIEMDLEVVDDRRFFERARPRELYAHVSRFGCPTGDASDLFDNAFHSLDARRGLGRINYSQYQSPEVDELIARTAGIASVQMRRAALEEIMRVVTADRPWVLLYVDEETFARDPRLEWRPRNDGYVRALEVRWSAR